MIEVKNLIKEYRNDHVVTRVLKGISFNIKEGEFIAIMGHSGSGKSTLMHIMGFLDRPTGGSYKFDGQSIDDLSDDELARIRNKKIGFVFQSFNLLARTSVLENVKLPLIFTGLSSKYKNDIAKDALKSVDLLHRLDHFPNQLSGGEQQRVAIARAIANHPSIIFADEPTGNLDSKSGQQIMEILQKLNEQGNTIILVTHEKYTSEMAKRIIELMDGNLIIDKKVISRKYARDGLLK